MAKAIRERGAGGTGDFPASTTSIRPGQILSCRLGLHSARTNETDSAKYEVIRITVNNVQVKAISKRISKARGRVYTFPLSKVMCEFVVERDAR